jgi:2-polyprenyl-3-methyl-5-hydroxy-6-metoxy-1,4-benzoquinol methylase
MSIKTKEYWETRLSERYDLTGVGDITLGVHFNKLLYKIRRVAFYRILKMIKPSKDASILDIGSGTGFYIEEWKKNEIKDINGIDITEKAIKELSSKYPDFSFIQCDIGDNIEIDPCKKYDIISAFDVLFHLVDDEKYQKAINNISFMLKNDGYFLFSDNFLAKEKRMEHQVSRTYDFVIKLLEKNNLKVISKTPMFVLMNHPIRSQNRFRMKFWAISRKIIIKQNYFSKIFASCLFFIERLLISIKRKGPSTEILICQKC